MKSPILCPISLFATTCFSSAAFLLDFNSNQSGGGTPVDGNPADPLNAAHNEPGYHSYHAAHEVAAGFITASYDANFMLTGAVNITLTPSWPNTTRNTVQQSIGRSDGQANSWLGTHRNLLRDWIGIDSRINEGGYGPWDGVTGTPTYMLLTLGNLPAAQYTMSTFHHDVENMNSPFTLEVSTDGGLSFGSIISGRMTNSTAGGTPAENEVLAGTAPNVAGGNPADLSSTLNFMFTADGASDVVLRFAPLSSEAALTHRTFFGINGFHLDQVPEPTTALLAVLGGMLVLRRRR